MTPEEFRTAGHQLIDWIADYRTNLHEGPVRSAVGPGDIAEALPADPPTELDAFDAVLADLETIVVPGLTQVQHPMHFGWFPANASLSSVLGDVASSGLGGLGISWESCPALTEVEEVVCDWLRQLTGLSDAWYGVIQDTASTGCLVALLAARERAADHVQDTTGLVGLDRPLVVYTTGQAHSSIAKAALLAGFGRDNLHSVEVDPETFAMRPEALAAAIEADLAAGKQPTAVVAGVGTTATTALDPVGALVEVAASHEVWMHVDAAMAGTAMLVPEYRWMWDGVEGADSISWNPHKWMGTLLDCSLFYVRDPEHLVRVMSTNPSYLRSSVDGEVTQYRDWGIPLGRRFRSLKLWFQLRLDGVAEIQDRVRRDIANAQWLAEQITATPQWEVIAPVPLQTVCFRHVPEGLQGDDLDAHTLRWCDAVNSSGQAFLSPSVVAGRWAGRVSIGVHGTERSHVEELWRLIQEAASTSESAS